MLKEDITVPLLLDIFSQTQLFLEKGELELNYSLALLQGADFKLHHPYSDCEETYLKKVVLDPTQISNRAYSYCDCILSNLEKLFTQKQLSREKIVYASAFHILNQEPNFELYALLREYDQSKRIVYALMTTFDQIGKKHYRFINREVIKPLWRKNKIVARKLKSRAIVKQAKMHAQKLTPNSISSTNGELIKAGNNKVVYNVISNQQLDAQGLEYTMLANYLRYFLLKKHEVRINTNFNSDVIYHSPYWVYNFLNSGFMLSKAFELHESNLDDALLLWKEACANSPYLNIEDALKSAKLL